MNSTRGRIRAADRNHGGIQGLETAMRPAIPSAVWGRSRLSLATCTARNPVLAPGRLSEAARIARLACDKRLKRRSLGVKEVLKDCPWRLSDRPLRFQYSPPSEGTGYASHCWPVGACRIRNLVLTFIVKQILQSSSFGGSTSIAVIDSGNKASLRQIWSVCNASLISAFAASHALPLH